MYSVLVILCLGIVAASLLGAALPLATVLTHTRLQLYLSFAAGTMLGAAFFHMMPEAVRLGTPETLWWSAGGLLALFFLERFFAFHHHEAPSDPTEPCPPHAHAHVPRRRTFRGPGEPRRGPARRGRARRVLPCTGERRRSAWGRTRWPAEWRWRAPSPRARVV